MVLPQIGQLQLTNNINTQLCIHSNKTDMQHSWSLNFRGKSGVLGERGVNLPKTLKFCNTRDLVTFLRGKKKDETCLWKWGSKVGSRIATISQSWEWIRYITTVSTHTVNRTIPFSKEFQLLGSFFGKPNLTHPAMPCSILSFQKIHTNLLGGFNQLERYACQIGSSPHKSGWNHQEIGLILSVQAPLATWQSLQLTRLVENHREQHKPREPLVT